MKLLLMDSPKTSGLPGKEPGIEAGGENKAKLGPEGKFDNPENRLGFEAEFQQAQEKAGENKPQKNLKTRVHESSKDALATQSTNKSNGKKSLSHEARSAKSDGHASGRGKLQSSEDSTSDRLDSRGGKILPTAGEDAMVSTLDAEKSLDTQVIKRAKATSESLELMAHNDGFSDAVREVHDGTPAIKTAAELSSPILSTMVSSKKLINASEVVNESSSDAPGLEVLSARAPKLEFTLRPKSAVEEGADLGSRRSKHGENATQNSAEETFTGLVSRAKNSKVKASYKNLSTPSSGKVRDQTSTTTAVAGERKNGQPVMGVAEDARNDAGGAVHKLSHANPGDKVMHRGKDEAMAQGGRATPRAMSARGNRYVASLAQAPTAGAGSMAKSEVMAGEVTPSNKTLDVNFQGQQIQLKVGLGRQESAPNSTRDTVISAPQAAMSPRSDESNTIGSETRKSTKVRIERAQLDERLFNTQQSTDEGSRESSGGLREKLTDALQQVARDASIGLRQRPTENLVGSESTRLGQELANHLDTIKQWAGLSGKNLPGKEESHVILQSLAAKRLENSLKIAPSAEKSPPKHMSARDWQEQNSSEPAENVVTEMIDETSQMASSSTTDSGVAHAASVPADTNAPSLPVSNWVAAPTLGQPGAGSAIDLGAEGTSADQPASAQTHPQQGAQSPSFSDSVRMLVTQQGGRASFSVQTASGERLHVEMNVHEGNAELSFRVQNPFLAQQIEQTVHELARSLKEAGIELSDVEIHYSSENQYQNSSSRSNDDENFDQSRRSSQNGGVDNEDNEEQEPTHSTVTVRGSIHLIA